MKNAYAEQGGENRQRLDIVCFISGFVSLLRECGQQYDDRFAIVAAISPQGQQLIAAAMWLGRNDGEFESFEQAHSHAKSLDKQGIVSYIAGKSPLVSYLQTWADKEMEALNG